MDSSSEASEEDSNQKSYIILMSRVHPGESNASLIMKGVIEFLISDEAYSLREQFIFKIVPMLNPDGVRYGNYRGSIFGHDLNRKWIEPDKFLSTSLYLTKNMITNISNHSNIKLVCDIHGHSNLKDFFLFGCSIREDPILNQNALKIIHGQN